MLLIKTVLGSLSCCTSSSQIYYPDCIVPASVSINLVLSLSAGVAMTAGIILCV